MHCQNTKAYSLAVLARVFQTVGVGSIPTRFPYVINIHFQICSKLVSSLTHKRNQLVPNMTSYYYIFLLNDCQLWRKITNTTIKAQNIHASYDVTISKKPIIYRRYLGTSINLKLIFGWKFGVNTTLQNEKDDKILPNRMMSPITMKFKESWWQFHNLSDA